jgi:dihydroflavonol-4-reductase
MSPHALGYMTSAAATARRRDTRVVSNENTWADSEDPLLDPYRRFKILAERAASAHELN